MITKEKLKKRGPKLDKKINKINFWGIILRKRIKIAIKRMRTKIG